MNGGVKYAAVLLHHFKIARAIFTGAAIYVLAWRDS